MTDTSWSLPGYDVLEPIAAGGSGEVWRAVELDTGEVVALKRLPAGASPEAVEALRREAAALQGLEQPHLVRLREAVDGPDGPVLVLDHAGGGSLSALLARRGSLDAGEVVTTAAPLAALLAELHGRGVVHGDVTPANVLFRTDGRPLLADLGLARLPGAPVPSAAGTAEYLAPEVAAGGEPTAEADVWALAAVCYSALAGSPPHDGGSVTEVLGAAADGGRAPLGLLAPTAPRALVEVVEAALHPDPALRPDAAAFASALRRAHAPAPVRLHGPAAAAPGPQARPTHAVPRHAAPAPPRDRRLPRRLAAAAAGVVLLLVAAGVGVWLGRTADPAEAGRLPAASGATTPPGPPAAEHGDAPTGQTAAGEEAAAAGAAAVDGAAPAEVDWAAVLDTLDEARATAFADADPDRLAEVYAPGTAARMADSRTIEALAAAGQRAVGVRHTVEAVEVEQATASRVRLRVVDTLAEHTVLDPDGTPARRVPSRGPATFTVELARGPDGWRLAWVAPA